MMVYNYSNLQAIENNIYFFKSLPGDFFKESSSHSP